MFAGPETTAREVVQAIDSDGREVAVGFSPFHGDVWLESTQGGVTLDDAGIARLVAVLQAVQAVRAEWRALP